MVPAQVLEEIEKNARQVARRYKRRAWWAPTQEMEQEAYCAQLRAYASFDTSMGVPAGAYLRRAAVLSVKALLWRLSSPVSYKHRPEKLAGILHEELPRSACSQSPHSHEIVERAHFARRVRDRVVELLGVEAAEYAIGMLTEGYTPEEAAHAHGVPVEQARQSLNHARGLMRMDRPLYELYQEDES